MVLKDRYGVKFTGEFLEGQNPTWKLSRFLNLLQFGFNRKIYILENYIRGS